MSWNVGQSANSSGRIDEQLEVIAEIDPDLVLLQEVRYDGANRWIDDWQEGLQNRGLSEFVHSCDWAAELHDSDVPPHSDIEHNNGHMTAVRSNWSLERWEWTIRNRAEEQCWTHFDTHFPEKILVSELQTAERQMEVWNIRAVPARGYGEEKIKIFETVYNRLSDKSENDRILGGDFNAPKEERSDGEIVTFASSKPDSIQERWKRAERNILGGIDEYGLIDAFRSTHGYGELSIPDTSFGEKRFDHLFVPEQSTISNCWYDHPVEASDHAPIVCDVAFS
jgi:exonuclease III